MEKDYSKCPKCGQQVYIIVGDSKGGWYHCYQANPDLSFGEEVEIKAGTRLDRADEVEDVVHYTCEIGLAGISSSACNKVYCTSRDELIAEFLKIDDLDDKIDELDELLRQLEEEESEEEPSIFMTKVVTPSKELVAVVGKGPMPIKEINKNLWDYIRSHGLQDVNNKSIYSPLTGRWNQERVINADAKLLEVFGGRKSVTESEMFKLVNNHLS